MGKILREWKRNPHLLLERFNTDGNGQIDRQEWDQAVEQAKRDAGAKRQSTIFVTSINALIPATDSRPLLVTAKDPADLIFGWQCAFWSHLVLFLTLALGTFFLLRLA
ncbi:MAG: hypothetical protein ACI8W7_002200 [Gammaproteobacteria bacterium]